MEILKHLQLTTFFFRVFFCSEGDTATEKCDKRSRKTIGERKTKEKRGASKRSAFVLQLWLMRLP